MTITKEQALEMIQAHNNSIDQYLNGELAERMGCKNGKCKISFDKWLQAQQLIRQQNFYAKGMSICKALRAAGYDVKMDCQRETLHYYGELL